MSKIDILVFDEDSITNTVIENYIGELTFKHSLKKYNEFDEKLIVGDSFKIIIVNVSSSTEIILEKMIDLVKNKKNKFIVISNENSTDLSVQAIRAGAKNFLLKPLKRADFLYAVQKIYKNEIAGFFDKKNVSHLFVSTSVEKSVGKTTFVMNLAKEVADICNEKVLLIDFNNTINDISFLLSLDIFHNTMHYMNKLTPENAKVLLPKLSKYKSSPLYVMANGFMRGEQLKLDKEKLYDTIKILKRYFKYIFVDLNTSLIDENELILRHADVVFMLAQPSHSMFEKIKTYTSINLKGKNIKVVLNKYEKKNDDSVQEYEQIIGKQIFWKIPKNFVATGTALNSCKTLKEVSPDLDIVKSYSKLAKYIVEKG